MEEQTRKKLYEAAVKAISEVGLETFKKTSLFMSNAALKENAK